ncbi:hypothetical protein J4437_08035 [Candidatus Woesearchaeota archaeon]|nr:hypothetical protein [Candidatus Woesearchaeota archaeon]
MTVTVKLLERGIEHYIKEIEKYPLLSRESERDIVMKMNSGDKNARTYFITSNLRLVIYVARKYAGDGELEESPCSKP